MDGLMRAPRLAPLTTSGGWGVRWVPSDCPRVRLFCVPHAGGGASVFRRWAQELAPEIEVVAVRLPGRESRFGQPAMRHVDDVVPALVRDLEPLVDRPVAWFGHSMGGVIAFEACRLLRRLGLGGELRRLVVAAARAPHLPRRDRPVHQASTPDFLERLRQLGGVQQELMQDGAAMALLLPTLRADFALAETYCCRPEPPLDCPISSYGGTADAFAVEEDVVAWAVHSRSPGRIRMLPGGHFFPHEGPVRLAPLVAADLLGRALL
jgi:medium-chain acyl-[acyl-carrier-protein] hydrolase